MNSLSVGTNVTSHESGFINKSNGSQREDTIQDAVFPLRLLQLLCTKEY